MFCLGTCFHQCIVHFLLLVCTTAGFAPPSNMLSLVWWCIILSRCNRFYQGPFWVSWEKWKKIKMLVRVGILLYVIISGEGLPLKTLLCHHPSSSFVTLFNAMAVVHYTLELGLRSLVCKVSCSALLPGHTEPCTQNALPLAKEKFHLVMCPPDTWENFLPILSFQQNIGAFHCTIDAKAFIHSISVKFHIKLKHI